MSYALLFTNCKTQQGKVTIPGDVDPYGRFAFYADRLLTGLDLGITFPGSDPGAHIDQVSLHWIDDFGTAEVPEVLVTTVFLVCECKARIEEKERAQSPLLTPKQKLYLQKR